MRVIIVAILIFLPTLVKGQFNEPKFGKVETSDLSMNSYIKDTTAKALMLFDNGSTEFNLDEKKGFQFIFSRHCQIKLFKKSAFSIGDVSIRLYKTVSGREELNNLKAVTYNLADGKIVKSKLDNDKIYRAEGKNYTDVSFAFPEIKEGSIIELSYSITSDFLYSLRGWNFQYNYPALWSQYTYEIPEYFDYRESTKGYLQFDVYKQLKGSVSFTLSSRRDPSEDGFGQVRQVSENTVIRASTEKGILATRDVPAFIAEPDIDCQDNYVQSMEFELKSIEFPGEVRKNYTQTWESVNLKMKEDEDFGQLIKMNGLVKDSVLKVCINKQSALERAISIYNHVQRRMKWNGQNSLYALDGLKKPYTEGAGSSGEINLLLTLMMRTAGFKSNPVMFSTRNNGIAVTYYPTITKFNSVLCYLEVEGKTYLLDASNRLCPFGVLPPNDLNGRGRMVDNTAGDWVNLDASEKFLENKNYKLSITPDGTLSGLITGSYDGYAGIYYRNAVNAEKTPDEYYKKLQENSKGLTINKFTIREKDNNLKPFHDSLNVDISDHTEMIGDKILFYPLLYERIDKNRYKLEERKYPVDYNYPISEKYTFDFGIPAGYKVESLPESATLKLPDNSISITYTIKNINNVIHVEYIRDVKNTMFLPDSYKALKNLYDELVKKHSEQVILKKSV